MRNRGTISVTKSPTERAILSAMLLPLMRVIVRALAAGEELVGREGDRLHERDLERRRQPEAVFPRRGASVVVDKRRWVVGCVVAAAGVVDAADCAAVQHVALGVVEAELAVLRADDDLRDQPVSPLS